MTERQADKIKGVFFGQAIGDALGLGTEFMTKQQIALEYPGGLQEYHQIIRDKHRSRWGIGDWTDDTDQFLCICDSILKTGAADDTAFAVELHKWFSGSPTGIGKTVYKVVSLPQFTLYPHKAAELVWKLSKMDAASNGAIMRTSILGTFEFWNRNNVIENTEKLAKVTHWDNRCVGSSVIISTIISTLIKEDASLSPREIEDIGIQYDDRILPYIHTALQGNLSDLQLEDSISLGYTLKTLAAGLWAFFHASDFENGVLSIIHEGGDADTNASVAGSLLGAKFGYSAIPKRWVEGLANRTYLDEKYRQYMDVVSRHYAESHLQS